MFDIVIRELTSRFGLGDKAQQVLRIAIAYIANPDNGGVAGFMKKFETAGLGDMIQSWLGDAQQAKAMSAEQVETVLGAGQNSLLNQVSASTGLARQTTSQAMTYLLPAVVSQLTPGGKVSAELPAAITGFLGGNPKEVWAGIASGATGMVGRATATPQTAALEAESKGFFMKLLPWILAALLGLGLLSFCSKRDDGTGLVPTVPNTNGGANGQTNAAGGTVGGTVNGLPVGGEFGATAAGATGAASSDATAAATTNAAASAAAAGGGAAGAASAAEGDSAAAIPEGASVAADLLDGKPRLKAYFAVSKTALAPEFPTIAASFIKYMNDNPNAKAFVSGFNDPSGNAAANAALSKNRAKSVQAALLAAGIANERIVFEKPANPTAGTAVSKAEARRVEAVIR